MLVAIGSTYSSFQIFCISPVIFGIEQLWDVLFTFISGK